jgi:hypothetical protein
MLALESVVLYHSDNTGKIYSSERITMMITKALQSEDPELIAEMLVTLVTFHQSFLKDGQPIESGTAMDLIKRLPDSLNLIISLLDDIRMKRTHYDYLLMALACLSLAAAKWMTRDDQERLFNIYLNVLNEIQVENLSDDRTTRKDQIKLANRMFDVVFTGLRAVLTIYQPNDPILRNHGVMESYIVMPTKKFLKLGSFKARPLIAFCEFLHQFYRVFGRPGNILLNQWSNQHLLGHALAIKNSFLVQRAEQTLKMIARS